MRKVIFNLLDDRKLLKCFELVSDMIREVQEDTFVSNRTKRNRIGTGSVEWEVSEEVLLWQSICRWPELGKLQWEWKERD